MINLRFLWLLIVFLFSHNSRASFFKPASKKKILAPSFTPKKISTPASDAPAPKKSVLPADVAPTPARTPLAAGVEHVAKIVESFSLGKSKKPLISQDKDAAIKSLADLEAVLKKAESAAREAQDVAVQQKAQETLRLLAEKQKSVKSLAVAPITQTLIQERMRDVEMLPVGEVATRDLASQIAYRRDLERQHKDYETIAQGAIDNSVRVEAQKAIKVLEARRALLELSSIEKMVSTVPAEHIKGKEIADAENTQRVVKNVLATLKDGPLVKKTPSNLQKLLKPLLDRWQIFERKIQSFFGLDTKLDLAKQAEILVARKDTLIDADRKLAHNVAKRFTEQIYFLSEQMKQFETVRTELLKMSLDARTDEINFFLSTFEARQNALELLKTQANELSREFSTMSEKRQITIV